MLLSEMVRKIRYERRVWEESGNIYQSSVTDWITVRTVNLTLPATCCLIIQFTAGISGSTSPYTVGGNARILIDGIPIVSTGEIYRTDGSTPSVTRTVHVVLSPGNHTVEFQLACFRIDASTNSITLLGSPTRFIRQICFSDMTNLLRDSGYVNVGAGQTATIINENITIPARKTCAGAVKQAQLHVYVYAEAENLRLSRMKNPGETNDVCINWRLRINDVATAWSDRRNDLGSDTTNQSFAEGAYGYYTALVNAGQTINIKVEAVNGTTTARNVRAVVVVFACPWIIPSAEYEPIALSFPQGSTLYMVLEPLSSDPTKTIRLGYVRAWDLGYNFYSTASGTGILSWNYTFESVEVEQAVLLVSGAGGCISIIAVDVR